MLSASPERLVVMLFEHLAVQLQRAKIAIEREDTALRTQSLGKARAIVCELLGTLDFEKGGSIAKELSALYSYMLNEMVDIGIRRDSAGLGKLVHIATELRDGFNGAAEQQAELRKSA